MLVQPVGVYAVATVGGPTTRLHVADAIGVGAEHAKKCFRMHGARADFHIVRLLEDAALLDPELGKLKDQVLEMEPLWPFLKFYFNSHVCSKSSRVIKRRSRLCSIQVKETSRNSLTLGSIVRSNSMRSSLSPAKRSASFLAPMGNGFIPARRQFSQKSPGWCTS